MRRQALLYILLFTSLISTAKENPATPHTFKLDGFISGQKEHVIILSINGKKHSLQTKNKKFFFEEAITEPTRVVLNSGNPDFAFIFYADTTDVKITMKESSRLGRPFFSDIKVTGSPHQQVFEEYLALWEDPKNKKDPAAFMVFISNKIMAYPNFKFWVNAVTYYKEVLGYEKTKAVYGQMNDTLRAYAGSIKKYLSQHELTQTSTTLPSFQQQSVDGMDFNPESLRGKIVLIDFWASWCGPCRAQFPDLKRVYQRHAAKGFELVGISVDEDKIKWKAALAKDKMGGIQLSDMKNQRNSFASAMSITSIPFNVLIDREGKIITTNISMAELDKWLAINLDRN